MAVAAERFREHLSKEYLGARAQAAAQLPQQPQLGRNSKFI